MKYLALRKYLILALAASASLFLIVGAEACTNREDMPWNPLDTSACPLVGNMGGIKLSIPWNIMLFGPSFSYVGEDSWSRSSILPSKRTYASALKEFTILLNLNTLRPISSLADLDSYRMIEHTKPQDMQDRDRFIGIEIINADKENSSACGGDMMCIYKNTMKFMGAKGWDGWAKVNKYSMKGLHNDNAKHMAVDEIDYNDRTNTFVKCTRAYMLVPPYVNMDFCEINFPVPEAHAYSRIQIPRQYLGQWEKIEEAVRRMTKDFVVQ